MIQIYPEQLNMQLQKGLRSCYMLFGNDQLLLQESQDSIRTSAENLRFSEYVSISLDTTTDWEAIFGMCHGLSLFSNRQILLLTLPENSVNAIIGRKLYILASLLQDDFVLILRGGKLTSSLENSTWFKELSRNAVLVSCNTPEHDYLPSWVMSRAKNMNLVLDEISCQFLCYCYEGNLLALGQALERFSLIYPDGILTLPRIESMADNDAHFTPFHWVDAVLAGKSDRASYILQQIRMEGSDPVILLRSIQREVLLLLTITKRKMTGSAVCMLFDQYRIWQKHQNLLTRALKRLGLQQLHQAVVLMIKIELALRQEYDSIVWRNISVLALLLCNNKPLPTAMING